MDKRELVLAKYTIVCKCRHISKLTIWKAIEAGASTMSKVERACSAHTGDCGGVRCGETIQRMLDEHAAKARD